MSQSFPNPDEKYADVSRDFVGQGIANLAVSLFQGLPVGGSLSSTALVVSAGAKTRLANVYIMHIYRSAEKVEIVEIVPLGGGRYEERPAPEQLPSNQVVVFSPRGSEHIYQQLKITGLLDQLGDEHIYRGTSILGDSTLDAYQENTAWLKQGTNEIYS